MKSIAPLWIQLPEHVSMLQLRYVNKFIIIQYRNTKSSVLPGFSSFLLMLFGNECRSYIWKSVWMKRASRRLDRLDAFYSLTHLLQVCANMALKYSNKKPRPSVEILLQSSHSYHLWHHLLTSPYPASSHRLPRFYWPLTPLFLTAYPSFLDRYYPALAFALFTGFQTHRWKLRFPSSLFLWLREGELRRFTISPSRLGSEEVGLT